MGCWGEIWMGELGVLMGNGGWHLACMCMCMCSRGKGDETKIQSVLDLSDQVFKAQVET